MVILDEKEEEEVAQMHVFLYSLVKIKLNHKVSEAAITDILLLIKSDRFPWISEHERLNFPKTYVMALTELKVRDIKEILKHFIFVQTIVKAHKMRTGIQRIYPKENVRIVTLHLWEQMRKEDMSLAIYMLSFL